MTAAAALDRVLPLFEAYYDVTRDGAAEPFRAEAAFHSHSEQYFLVRAAKMAESDAHEYVFFAVTERLTADEAARLDTAAWTEGLRRARPGPNHRSTDVGLILLADTIDPAAAAYIRKLRRSKSYRLTLQGWSNYRVIALETSTGRTACNRMGRGLRKLLGNINLSE